MQAGMSCGKHGKVSSDRRRTNHFELVNTGMNVTDRLLVRGSEFQQHQGSGSLKSVAVQPKSKQGSSYILDSKRVPKKHF